MENWDFNQTDYSNLNNAQQEYVEVPDGQYACFVENLELARSKKGFPMVKARFKIKDGEYAGKLMFANKVLLRSFDGSTNDSFLVHNCNAFLESFNVITDVKLSTLSVYSASVDYIRQQVATDSVYYIVDKVTNKGFADYTIVEGPLTYEPVNSYPDYQAPSQPVGIPEPGAPLPQQSDDIPF